MMMITMMTKRRYREIQFFRRGSFFSWHSCVKKCQWAKDKKGFFSPHPWYTSPVEKCIDCAWALVVW